MLEVRDLSLHYGRHLALDGVSIRIEPGETVVILGANGAGKSSLLKSIAGLVHADPCTQICLDEVPLTGLPTHRIVENGIALVPEGRGVFGELTVEENLLLGANPARARVKERERKAQVLDLFPKLRERQHQAVNTMSGGEQQMVAIGRALMSNPAYLMLDEPSLGLAPVMVTELFLALDRIRKSGVALLIVEQNVLVSLSIADRGYLIEAGRIVGADTSDALLNNETVQRAFLGKATERG